MLAHRHPMDYLDNSAAVIDLVVIASLLTAVFIDNLGFLRLLRTLRLMRSYQVLGRLKERWPVVKRNEEIIGAALNLAVFVLIISAIVFVTQAPS
jgi:voltage-gated potassium channel